MIKWHQDPWYGQQSHSTYTSQSTPLFAEDKKEATLKISWDVYQSIIISYTYMIKGISNFLVPADGPAGI